MPDHSEPYEPSLDYIEDYDYDAAWDLLEQQQREIARERDERLYGKVVNDDE